MRGGVLVLTVSVCEPNAREFRVAAATRKANGQFRFARVCSDPKLAVSRGLVLGLLGKAPKGRRGLRWLCVGWTRLLVSMPLVIIRVQSSKCSVTRDATGYQKLCSAAAQCETTPQRALPFSAPPRPPGRLHSCTGCNLQQEAHASRCVAVNAVIATTAAASPSTP